MPNPSISPTSPTPPSDARITDELARRYLARVIVHARRMARQRPARVALHDLISAGLLGAVEGFLRFDPDRAETLDAYLDHHIRSALLDELRRVDPFTRTERDVAQRLRYATQAPANDVGDARDESLAKSMERSLAAFRSRLAQVQAGTTQNLRSVRLD